MNRLKEFRRIQKITAKQLADAVGTSRSNISMIEIGLRKADIELAKRIADYFGTTIEEIFLGMIATKRDRGINHPPMPPGNKENEVLKMAVNLWYPRR